MNSKFKKISPHNISMDIYIKSLLGNDKVAFWAGRRGFVVIVIVIIVIVSFFIVIIIVFQKIA